MTILGYLVVITHEDIYEDYEDYTSTSDLRIYNTLRGAFNSIKHFLRDSGKFHDTTFKVEIDTEIEKYEGKKYNKLVGFIGDEFYGNEHIIIRTVVAKEDPGDISEDEYLIEDDSEEEVED